MADVTDLVRESEEDLSGRISREARITTWHTSSDYGEAFADFAADHLQAISQRAKRTFWRNPESAMRWSLGDSVAIEYAEVVQMYECCNVDQLTKFITRLLPA